MAVPTPQRTTRLIAVVSLTSIMIMGCFGLGFTVFALDLLSNTRAYITGESLWSKGQQEAVYNLERYIQTSDPEYLARARAGLAVPLGDRNARLALNLDPPDLEAAREGFLQGGNHPDDISGMIRLYRYFGNAPYIRDAIALWKEGDGYILAIEAVADALELEMSREPPRVQVLAQLRAELERLNDEVRPLEEAFSRTLGEGARWLFNLLVALSIAVLVMVVAAASGIFWWATRRIAESEYKFRTTFEHVAVGMAQIAPDGRFIDVNDSLCMILGQPREVLLKVSLADIVHNDDRHVDDEWFESLWEGGVDSYTVEKRLLRYDGSTLWGKLTLSSVEQSGHIPRYLIVVIEDVSVARKLSSELSHQARHDALTGLINRREFEQRLSGFVDDARTAGDQHVLCFVDLDQFKVINDTCGHMAGDELLRQATDILRHHLRRGDVLARLGGDEFGVIFAYCDIESAVQVADKLRTALSETEFSWEGASFKITASMGLAAIGPDTTDVFSLLKAADTACYLAKDHGRNCVHVYTEDDLNITARRNEMEWVGRIQDAIRDDRLRLAAQYIVPMQDGDKFRYELLVRLIDTDGHVFMPGIFLPAAERYNIASLVDRWVIGRTLDLLEQNPGHIDRLEACHINLSGQSLGRPEFLEFVESRLLASGVSPGRICFEITETAAVSCLLEARQFIERLTRLGCRFALDDFGSGLSSFGYLRSLPVDIIKIDGSFVRNMHEDDIHYAMVRSINEIGHLMGKQTVAEFVESDAVLARLRQLGVDYVQGNAIHRPRDFEALLADSAAGAVLHT